MLIDELFTKALQILETCLSVNNILCRKLVSTLASPIVFDDRFKFTSAPFFIFYFNSLSCQVANFTFESFYIDTVLKQNKFTIFSQSVPCEKSKIIYFASSIMNNIVVFTARCRFSVKIICYIVFGSASSTCCLLIYCYHLIVFFLFYRIKIIYNRGQNIWDKR